MREQPHVFGSLFLLLNPSLVHSLIFWNVYVNASSAFWGQQAGFIDRIPTATSGWKYHKHFLGLHSPPEVSCDSEHWHSLCESCPQATAGPTTLLHHWGEAAVHKCLFYATQQAFLEALQWAGSWVPLEMQTASHTSVGSECQSLRDGA